MAIAKPYHRLWRPVKGYDPLGSIWQEDHPVASLDYLRDERFACQAEMRSLLTTAKLILDDLYELFNYIEPDDTNLSVFSHRIYELLLRTATEFETNCKGILKDNGYAKADNKMNMSKDYFKLASVMRLSEYKVVFDRWSTNHQFDPFIDWNTTSYLPLTWYQGYNNVKHNRYSNFKQASLENLMNSLAGLLCILHAQYGEKMAYGFVNNLSLGLNYQEQLEIEQFTIIAPTFPEAEQYDFIWDVLKTEPNPVQKYIF